MARWNWEEGLDYGVSREELGQLPAKSACESRNECLPLVPSISHRRPRNFPSLVIPRLPPSEVPEHSPSRQMGKRVSRERQQTLQALKPERASLLRHGCVLLAETIGGLDHLVPSACFEEMPDGAQVRRAGLV